jgi:hypothetical protein
VSPYLSLKVKNEYFEVIDSIKVSNLSIPKINVGDQSNSISIIEGKCIFRCLTKSNLEILANLNLIASKQEVIIVVSNNGSVQIK